jgi:PAS domain S-box-containing protein
MTTESKRKEELKAKLREGDPTYRYYKSIFHLTRDMIALSDGYHIIDANTSFIDFFASIGVEVFTEGFSLHEHFLQIDKYGYVYEGYLNLPWYKTVLRGEKEHYRVGISAADKIYTFSVSVTPLHPSEEVYVLTLSDVTDMISYKCILEEGIRVSTDEKEAAKYILQQFNQAIDESNLVSRCNLDGIITYVNDALCTTLCYEREELIGNSMALFFECDREIICKNDAWSSIEEGRVWKGKVKNKDKFGGIHHFATTIVPIKNFENQVVEILAIRHNITEMVKAKEEALDNLEAKTRFFDQVSHELRTPLNAIVNFTDQALEEYEGICEDAVSRELVKKYLQRAYANAENLLELINLLLDVAKMRSGKTTFEIEPHDPSLLVEEAFQNCSSLVASSTVEYRFKSEKWDQKIKCDGVKFKQMITNLISNALKFTTDGFVEVRVDSRSDECIVEVEDSGIGIPHDRLSSIFEPFSQARNHGFGTGLGLAIVREYAEAMGMTLEVHSREGEGSRFTLRIPLA